MQIEMSIEMRKVALDKMIEIRKQLLVMQDNLGVYNCLDKDSTVLIYSTEDFFEIARHVKANITSGNLDECYLQLFFKYNETTFTTYILPDEYQLYESEIDASGDEDV